MFPHWSSLPEPEISGEAVAFALVATQSRRSGREMRENACHALGSNSDSAQERQPDWYAPVSAARSPAHGYQECAVFQRTRSDPLAKRARDTTHALSVLSSTRPAHTAADSGWKRVCVERASSASRIDDVETTYSSDLTQFETHPSSAHGWSSFGDDDADSRVFRASSASSATLAPSRVDVPRSSAMSNGQDGGRGEPTSRPECSGNASLDSTEAAQDGPQSAVSHLLLPLNIDIPPGSCPSGFPPSWLEGGLRTAGAEDRSPLC